MASPEIPCTDWWNPGIWFLCVCSFFVVISTRGVSTGVGVHRVQTKRNMITHQANAPLVGSEALATTRPSRAPSFISFLPPYLMHTRSSVSPRKRERYESNKPSLGLHVWGWTSIQGYGFPTQIAFCLDGGVAKP